MLKLSRLQKLKNELFGTTYKLNFSELLTFQKLRETFIVCLSFCFLFRAEELLRGSNKQGLRLQKFQWWHTKITVVVC